MQKERKSQEEKESSLKKLCTKAGVRMILLVLVFPLSLHHDTNVVQYRGLLFFLNFLNLSFRSLSTEKVEEDQRYCPGCHAVCDAAGPRIGRRRRRRRRMHHAGFRRRGHRFHRSQVDGRVPHRRRQAEVRSSSLGCESLFGVGPCNPGGIAGLAWRCLGLIVIL